MNMTVQKISVAQAEDILKEQNTQNYRKRLNNNHVEFLAREMSNNRWKLNGETIKFDTLGNLRDGQHRLAACVRSGKTLTTCVLKGLPLDGIDVTYDTGKARLASDLLEHAGFSNANALGAIIRLTLGYIASPNTACLNYKASNVEILNAAIANPEFATSCQLARPLARFAPGKLVGFLNFVQTQLYGQGFADDFFTTLRTGDHDAGDGDPAWALREFYTSLRHGTDRKGRKRDALEILAITISASNYAVLERPVKFLRWQRFGPKRQAFPRFLDDERLVLNGA